MNVKDYVIKITTPLDEHEKIKYAFRLLRNMLVHEIVGTPPNSTLLRHAWDYKKQYTLDFINNYYTIHKILPRNRHNVGNSFFPAVNSYVDFTALKQQIYNDCTTKSIYDYPNWVRIET